MLRLYVDRDQSDWDEWLPLCNMAYNGSVHSSSGYSPFFMMYGRDLRLPVEMVFPSPDYPAESRQAENSADQFVSKLTEVFHHVYVNDISNFRVRYHFRLLSQGFKLIIINFFN